MRQASNAPEKKDLTGWISVNGFKNLFIGARINYNTIYSDLKKTKIWTILQKAKNFIEIMKNLYLSHAYTFLGKTFPIGLQYTNSNIVNV